LEKIAKEKTPIIKLYLGADTIDKEIDCFNLLVSKNLFTDLFLSQFRYL
jgi:hypothetical protein